MSRSLRVSVIALNYNQERWLLETLDSINTQTFRDFELIFCDDASNDNSVSVAKRWLANSGVDYQCVLHQQNQGICRTLNEALTLASGEYVQLIACDDLLHRNKLETHVAMLDRLDASYAAVHSPSEIIGPTGNRKAPYTFAACCNLSDSDPRVSFESLLARNVVSAPTVLLRREAIDKVGGYDEDLSFEDWDMWLRILRKYKFAWHADFSASYRLHGANTHRAIKPYHPDRVRMLLKHSDRSKACDQLYEVAIQSQAHGELSDSLVKDVLGVISGRDDSVKKQVKKLFDSATRVESGSIQTIRHFEESRSIRLARWIGKVIGRV